MTTLVATPLTTADRCDECPAQAYVQVSVLVSERGKDMDLLFCAHHFAYHQPVLLYRGARILIDNRDQLNN
jgi:hypothetical protein